MATALAAPPFSRRLEGEAARHSLARMNNGLSFLPSRRSPAP